MIAQELIAFFDDTYSEIEEYLNFLDEIELAAGKGPPKIEGSKFRITAPQQKVLYSSVYLQLYNLVEATVSRCIDAITNAAASSNHQWRPGDLNAELRKEWVRSVAGTHTELTPDSRLKQAVEMCDHLIEQLPMNTFRIDLKGGGNWDDERIKKISLRIGCRLYITPETEALAKRAIRDDLGALKLVRNRRNSLAHGVISFTDCADGVTVAELRSISDAVGAYLREAIACFGSYVDLFEFLIPERKPTGTA